MPAAARSGGDLRLRDEEAEMTQLLLRAAEAVDEEPGTGTETAKAEAMARLATGDGGGGGGWRSVRHGTARRVAFVVVLEGDAARETGACGSNRRGGGVPTQFACGGRCARAI
jgi:hypothetical protein